MLTLNRLVVALTVVALPCSAWAKAFDIRVRGKALDGKGKPALTLHVNQPIQDLQVELTADGLEPIVWKSRKVKSGQALVRELDVPLGKTTISAAIRAVLQTGDEVTTSFSFEVELVPSVEIMVADDDIDLEEHRLKLTMSSRAAACRHEVLFDNGNLDQGETTFAGEPAGKPLPVAWKQGDGDAVVMRIRLFCSDADGNESAVDLYPWRLEIPHEDVTFRSGKAVIARDQEPKLVRLHREILRATERYSHLLAMKLYVSGHTDTAGRRSSNKRLSLARAKAIAEYLGGLGVDVPVFFTGFGEDHLAVATSDGVAEPRNRRVRYILGVNPPEVGNWHPLPVAAQKQEAAPPTKQ